MLDRRTLFSTAAAGATAASQLVGGRKAKAAKSGFKGDVEMRGSKGRLERLPTLDLESKHDFTAGFRTWHRKFNGVANTRIEKILQDNGLDPKGEYTMEEVLKLIEHDPVVGASGRTWISNQQVTWKVLQDHFHENADAYLAEMEAAEMGD